MRRGALVLAAFLLGACAKPPPPRVTPPLTAPVATPSALAALADGIGVSTTSPLEPQMPLELRVLLPPKEEALSSEELLRRARDHASVFAEKSSLDDYATAVREALLAIALAERASASESATAVEASAFLVDLLHTLVLRQSLAVMLRSSAASIENAEAQKVAAMLRGFETLAPQMIPHLQKHAARVLRAGTPKAPVVAVLWQLISDADETKTLDRHIAEYRRLKPVLEAAELTRVAELHAQVGERARFVEDAALARTAIGKLDGPRRPLLARLALAEEKRADSERLLVLRGDDVVTRLERFGLLDRLKRTTEADVELDAAERMAPGDGRVRARLSHRAFRRSVAAKGLIAAAAEGRAALHAVPITAPSLEDARVDLGFAGLECATATAKLKDGPQPAELLTALAPLEASLERFARFDPDAAAGVVHAERRVREVLLLSPAERPKRTERIVREGTVEIKALRQRLPANADVMRVALVYAERHPDPVEGLALALDDRGYGSPPHDVDVALERVATALTLVTVTADMRSLPALRASLDAIPPDLDDDREGARLALLADVAMLEALASKGAAWLDVAKRYEEAEAALSSQRARLRNNRVYALRRAGQDAITLWDAAAESGAAGELRVIAWLNVNLARGATYADLRSHAETGAATAVESGQSDTASVLYRWLAQGAPDRATAKKWALQALEVEGGTRGRPDAPPGTPLHCQPDNRVALGVNTKVMGYVFAAQAVCRLWLTDAKLPNRARLNELAGKPAPKP